VPAISPHSRLQDFDLVRQVTNMTQYTLHSLRMLASRDGLLPDNDRLRIGSIPMAVLERLWRCSATDEMGLAQLLTGHLKK
jgi:hypothetical protein